jgi:predicted transposase YbfD/YdcC
VEGVHYVLKDLQPVAVEHHTACETVGGPVGDDHPLALLDQIIAREQEKVTVERRDSLSSLDTQAACFAQAVRGHWGIENSLQWSLDVTFKEDAGRIRQGQAAENFAVLRHMALSLLQPEKTTKVGLKTKRFKAALDTHYLTKVLIGN